MSRMQDRTPESAPQNRNSIEFSAWQWRETHKPLKEVSKEASQPGAAFLSFHRELMVSASERLLELGLDISDHHHPQVVPVPIARHPKTKAEARRWEAKIAFRIDEYMLAFAVTGTGTHVIHSTVGKEALADALTPHLDQPHELTKATILNSFPDQIWTF